MPNVQRAEWQRTEGLPALILTHWKKKLKNVQGKKQLRTSELACLSQNEIQTESHAMIYFSWQHYREMWGEEDWRKGGRLEGQQRSRAGHIRERKGWWDYFSRDLSFRMKWIRNISPLKLSSRAAVCLQQTCKQHVYICTIPLTLVQDVSCICLSWGEYLSMFRPGTNVQLCDQEHLKSMFSSTVTTYRVCLRTHVSTFLSVYGHNLSSGHCCFYSRCPLIYCWLNNHHPASKTVYVV